MTDAATEDLRLCLSVINWGEVYYVTLREYSEEKARQILQIIDQLPIDVVEAERTLTLHAAQMKAGGGMAYADCFAAALALQEKGEVLTGDPEFERIEGEISIRWLPRRS